MEERNPFDIAKVRIVKAANALGLDEATTTLLCTPQREIAVALPVKMDDGSTKIFQGFRVQFNTARGPLKAVSVGFQLKRSTLFARCTVG